MSLRYRASLAFACFLKVLFVVSFSGQAQAQNECGSPVGAPPFSMTCSSDPTSYSDGIGYDATTNQFFLTLDSTVLINRGVGPGHVGVSLHGHSSDGLSLVLEDGVKIEAVGHQADGARVFMSGDGNVVIQSAADIWVDGNDPLAPWYEQTTAIFGYIGDATNSSGDWAGDIEITQQAGSSLNLAGYESMNGVYALHYGLGNIVVSGGGAIHSNEPDAVYGLQGVIANSLSGGDVFVRQEQSGEANFMANNSVVVFASHDGVGASNAELAGISTLIGDGNDGVVSYNGNIGSNGTVSSIVSETAIVSLEGNRNYGARAVNYGHGETHVLASGSISVVGNSQGSLESGGIKLTQRFSTTTSAQTVVLSGAGNIFTDGYLSHGAVAAMENASLVSFGILDHASIVTLGEESHGIKSLSSANGAVELGVSRDASVNVFGRGSVGALLDAGGQVMVANAGDIASTGEYGIGIYADSTHAGAELAVDSQATLTGGWQSDMTLAPGVAFPSAGVLFNAADDTALFNSGTIGAGSDRAIGDLATSAGDISVSNWGQVTGFLDFNGANGHSFTNFGGGDFSVRHFADTNGDGVRDTKRVSISNFGVTGGTFDNQAGGRVVLGVVTGNSATDATDYYVPTTGVARLGLDASIYDLKRFGIVQGQFTNLSRFTNAGILDLRGPTIGNTFVMTGNADAAMPVGLTGGEFVADGGYLLLNAVLNEGLAPGGQTNSQADVLVVDRTSLAGAPTNIVVDRRQGVGGQTPGNGILLVEVRDNTSSTPDVFTLSGDFEIGGQQLIFGGVRSYALFHNGVGVDELDGNWYLRNVGLSPHVPVYEDTPEIVRPMVEPPTLVQRVGNRQWQRESAAAVEPLAVFCKDASQNFRCAVTPDQAVFYLSDDGAFVDSRGLWARADGLRGHYVPQTSTSSAGFGLEQIGLQAGWDSLIAETENGALVGGVSLRYLHSAGTSGIAVLNADGFGLGGSLTYYDDGGFYVDGQALGLWYRGKYSSGLMGLLADDVAGLGYGASLEVGQRINLSDRWSITPQVQLSYTDVTLDPFTDLFGAVVSIDRAHSLRGRLGMAAEYEDSWIEDDGTISRFKAHGIVNLHHEFLRGNRVLVSGESLESLKDPQWVSAAFGATYNWRDDQNSLYGEISAGTGLANFGESYEFKGTVGLRIGF